MPAPTIYYIRHGETAWNAEGRLQGTLDIPLNKLGRKQAVHAGNILGELLERDGRDKLTIPFVCSPLGRARATMDFVREVMNLSPGGYAIDDRLREIGYGAWEGLYLAYPALSTQGFTRLRFWIHGGSAGGQQVQVVAYLPGGAQGTPVPVTAPVSNAWTEVSIPLADLGVANATLTGLVWQDRSGGTQPTLYVDDIALVDDLPTVLQVLEAIRPNFVIGQITMAHAAYDNPGDHGTAECIAHRFAEHMGGRCRDCDGIITLWANVPQR